MLTRVTFIIIPTMMSYTNFTATALHWDDCVEPIRCNHDSLTVSLPVRNGRFHFARHQRMRWRQTALSLHSAELRVILERLLLEAFSVNWAWPTAGDNRFPECCWLNDLSGRVMYPLATFTRWMTFNPHSTYPLRKFVHALISVAEYFFGVKNVYFLF